ncbi:permease [[Actinomadura] parvosata subsp. kistnae]|uniref:Permease n=1 Tax=[Actinomadura] parvosata subsp. kistnae TaxID=1909395 RepID=A0A1V0AGW6_9ACTN|nr:ZIP family metal transporter [Nonomuraea sp. ATCC 55076]AQZ69433.1 permease [Nonomuraea sp. ATCC 55076]SPL91920.1 permease [Actinomadura parvosata subsp. kistnae]
MPILLSLAAFVMTLLGGLVADRIGRRRHLVLGFAAGVMLGVVAFDLLPEALALSLPYVHGVPLPMLTLALAFLTIHVVERSLGMHDAHETDYATHRHARANVGLTAASALVLHSFLDGSAIGAAYQTNPSLAVAVAIGVIAHDFTDGFNTYTLTSLYGNARRRALTLLTLDALAPIAGATLTSLLPIPDPALGAYLGLFAGFLLYLATSDILPEAHTPRRATGWTLTATVLGALFMWGVIGLTD